MSERARVRAVVYPRDANPYQAQLYSAAAASGMEIVYAGGHTRSHALNLLLLPLELLARRLSGWNVLHLHWTYAFGLYGSRRFPILYRFASFWFVVVLATARACGLRIVWTAHNVLPHERVFHDDVAAGLRLVSTSDLVIVHSPAAERELTELLGRPSRVAVVPHPPFASRSMDREASSAGPLRLLFFGRIGSYKGVEDLLLAMHHLGPSTELRLTVAGACEDRGLAARLSQLSRRLDGRVALRLERVPEEDVPTLLGEHDLLMLPFRRTTTSGSALLGLGAGMTVAVPDLPTFEGMPVLRFEPGVDGIVRFLESLAEMEREVLVRLGESGRAWAAAQSSWQEAGEATARMVGALLDDGNSSAA